MNTIFEILKFTIPSLITGGIIYFLFRTYLDNVNKTALLEIRRQTQKDLLPIQLQAYERLVLYLERISVNNLMVRVSQPGMTARQLQSTLTSTIRDEFEHNLSQQLYVSDKSWEMVVNAKEELLKVINQSASPMNEEADATELAAAIFTNIIKLKHSPVGMALAQLKKEMRERF